MRVFLPIVKKEILDALRDSKSLSTALLIPILFAIMSFAMLNFSLSLKKNSEDIRLAVDGGEHIHPLIASLEEHGIKIVSAPPNPEQAILERKYHMILLVPDEFVETFRLQKTADLHLLSDHSRSESYAKVSRIKNIIRHWSRRTGALRLISRNVSPSIANPINLVNINVTGDERLASKILAGFPLFILMIAFAGGIGMIADMASGERERRSLEPLLINPVSHGTVFTGKWIAAVLVTLAITVIGIALQFVSINASPLAELGLRISMGIDKFLIILLITIPIVCFAAALELVVSFFARSFKDAQTYNGLLTILPTIPGIYLALNSGSAQTWQMFVPMLGPAALIADIVGGEGASAAHILITSTVSCLCAALSMFAGILLLKNEKTIFG